MGSLLFTACTLGLLGGVHCVSMCGGIVGAVSLRPAHASVAMHLFYNAGRLLSYAAAGAIAGAFGTIGLRANAVLPMQMTLLVVANALVILLGLHIAGWGNLVLRFESVGAALWRRVAPFAGKLLPADSLPKAMALGAVWGSLPCGLVCSALALALLAGTPLLGALVMLAFGLGHSRTSWQPLLRHIACATRCAGIGCEFSPALSSWFSVWQDWREFREWPSRSEAALRVSASRAANSRRRAPRGAGAGNCRYY